MGNISAHLLCLALLALSANTHGRNERRCAEPYQYSERGKPVWRDEGNPAALTLPKGKDAWLVEIRISGGMRPIKNIVQINSAGEIAVVSEQFRNGAMTVICSRKEKISAREVLKIKAAVTSAKPSAWKDHYSDPQHPVCCDQPTTAVKLERRDDKGREADYSASWYPGSYDLVPTDLKGIVTFIRPLWDATRAKCDK